MIRVVLDTNIIVSALLQPLGPPVRIFVLTPGGALQLCVSATIYAEYEEVISRERLQRSQDIIASTLLAVREKGLWVRPGSVCGFVRTPMTRFFSSAPRPRRLIIW